MVCAGSRMTVKTKYGIHGGGGVAGGEDRSMIILLAVKGRSTQEQPLNEEWVLLEIDKKSIR